MALRDKQETLVELGRIRTGQRVQAQSGKLRPDKLETFKFTSPIEHLIIEVAALYGGEPGTYTGEGVRGKQFQVVTDTNTLPVYLPKQRIDPFYERWSGGVCTRRCDSIRDSIHDAPCDCSADPEERVCKPTTRLNVMLADVPGLGQWRLETHSIYAAMEMTQIAGLLGAVNMPVPGRLVLESRARKFFNRKKQQVETRDYYVPIVVIDSVTARQVQIGGDALTQAIQMSNGATAAVEAAPTARAIEAGPAVPDPAMIERGLKAIGSATPDRMADLHERIKKMGSPQVLLDAFKLRLGEHADQMERTEVAEMEAAWSSVEPSALAVPNEQGATVSAVDAPPAIVATVKEVDAAAVAEAATDDGDRAAAMMELLGVAGKLKINTKQLEAEIERTEGVSRTQASAAQLRKVTAFLVERGAA
jgi:hypothetical protein